MSVINCLCFTFHLRLWSSLWCSKWAKWSSCKVEEHWYCSASETWLLADCWDTVQQWPLCMPVMGADGVADEEVQCGEVWWANLAAIGGGGGPLHRWSKHGACKENSQETQGWRYIKYHNLSKVRPWVMNFSGSSKSMVGTFLKTCPPHTQFI